MSETFQANIDFLFSAYFHLLERNPLFPLDPEQ